MQGRRRGCCPDGGSTDRGMGRWGAGFNTLSAPPFFSSFPFLFLSLSVAGCPPLRRRQRGRSHSSGRRRRRRRKKPAPPPLSAYLPPSRAAEDGCERWRQAGRGLPVSASADPRATRGAQSEGEKPRPLLGRGGDSLFASARVGKEAKRLVVGGGGGGRSATPPRSGGGVKCK